ncbi:MAG: amidohydrolase family protein, partial [Microbacterium sp.]
MDSPHEGAAQQDLPQSARYALVGARIALVDRMLDGHALLIRDGAILGSIPEDQVPAEHAVHRLAGGVLAPGLIDVHMHGALGYGFNDASTGTVREIGRVLLDSGVTTVLPTLASAAQESLLAALDAIDEAGDADDTARMPGAHLEGPYLSPAQRGAQTAADLRSPDDGSAAALLDRAASIRMMSLAPELPGAEDLIRRLVAHDIVAAAGHSDGTIDDLRRAQDAGLTHVIHLYSSQSTTRREG